MVSTQLRAARRMHSTSQKRIAYGSRFWGVMDSFPRRTSQIVPLVTARQNRREETSPKCCMVSSPPSLVRLPVQNVERCTPTFQSGAAARVGVKTILHLRRKHFCQQTARQGVIYCASLFVQGERTERRRWRRKRGERVAAVEKIEESVSPMIFSGTATGGQGTIGSLRRFFPIFLSAGGKKRGRRRQDTPISRREHRERQRGADRFIAKKLCKPRRIGKRD